VLACTSTNKAIDSLVAKLEDAGVQEILTVGRRDGMGEISRRYLFSERLSRDPLVNAAEASLAQATHQRECAEEALAKAKKPTKPKKDTETGKENNRGFVERQLGKLKDDKSAVKKTPGITRLLGMLGLEGEAIPKLNRDLVASVKAFLAAPAAGDDAKVLKP
jgi:hypothetical protein